MVAPLRKKPGTRDAVFEAVRGVSPRFTFQKDLDLQKRIFEKIEDFRSGTGSRQALLFPDEEGHVRNVIASRIEHVEQKERIVVATEADIPQIVELYKSRSVHDGNQRGIEDFPTYGGIFSIPTEEDLRKNFKCPEYKMYVLKKEIDGIERVMALVDFLYPPGEKNDPTNSSSIYFDTIHGPPYEEVRQNMRVMGVHKDNIFWVHDYLRARKSVGGRSSDVMKLLSHTAIGELDMTDLDNTGVVSEIIVSYTPNEEELAVNEVSARVVREKLGFIQVGTISGMLNGCRVLKHVYYLSAKNLASKMFRELASSS